MLRHFDRIYDVDRKHRHCVESLILYHVAWPLRCQAHAKQVLGMPSPGVKVIEPERAKKRPLFSVKKGKVGKR